MGGEENVVREVSGSQLKWHPVALSKGLAFTHQFSHWRVSAEGWHLNLLRMHGRERRQKQGNQWGGFYSNPGAWWWLGPEREQEGDVVLSGAVLRIKPSKCVGRLELGCLRKRKVKDNSRILSWATERCSCNYWPGWGNGHQELSLGHVDFQMPIGHSRGMLNRQLDTLSLEFKMEVQVTYWITI